MTPYYQDDYVTLFHGDCLEVLPSLPEVDFVLTDPPYEISASGGGIGGRRQYLSDIKGFTDCGFDASLLAPFDRWACFCGLSQLPALIAAARQRWCLVTWNKPAPTPLVNGNYLPDAEYIIHAFPSGSALYGEYRDRSRFIVCSSRGDTSHPNEKPLPVIAKMVRVGSAVGETILDPYAGTGTTLRAAKDLGRRAIGIEIEERYCEIAARRLSQEVLNFAEPEVRDITVGEGASPFDADARDINHPALEATRRRIGE